MARGDHPQRTPFYGVVMIIAALLAAFFVYRADPAPWVQVIVFVVAAVVAAVGFVMTFRDYSR
ncbi:hypothetical protein [Rhodococcus sp. HNM0569]|uniref:hypothetical protein n=1 Tax=Rhodococcus sp. HNM0569 TaxID=2716340 RepID=UPI00146B344A|nr:hypothetical protein [Rhodococcus sp. HNM0569]NLU83770.1 hypothetical protein [Rhodococcus sp. HNM0569]